MIFRPLIPIQSFETLRRVNILLDEPNRKHGCRVILNARRAWAILSSGVPFRMPTTHLSCMDLVPPSWLPTATNKNLGTEKWSAGPMGLGVYIGEKWIVGGVGQHWWSYAGDNDRQSVNLTDFQYIIRYRLGPQTTIGMAPNIQMNWDADSGEKLRLPVGFGGEHPDFSGTVTGQNWPGISIFCRTAGLGWPATSDPIYFCPNPAVSRVVQEAFIWQLKEGPRVEKLNLGIPDWQLKAWMAD